MKKVLPLLFLVIILCSSSRGSFQKPFTVDFSEPELNVYQLAESISGCPVELLYGFSFTESSFNQFAIGDDGMSKGLTQSNENFHAYYVSLWGEYNPFDALDSLVLAGRIYMKDLKTTGNIDEAICAHRQGVTGVRKNGITDWYLSRVMNQADTYTKLSYFDCFATFSDNLPLKLQNLIKT